MEQERYQDVAPRDHTVAAFECITESKFSENLRKFGGAWRKASERNFRVADGGWAKIDYTARSSDNR